MMTQITALGSLFDVINVSRGRAVPLRRQLSNAPVQRRAAQRTVRCNRLLGRPH